jgi:hypothetical protein
MDLKQIKTLLEDTFNKELSEGKKRHIVFGMTITENSRKI